MESGWFVVIGAAITTVIGFMSQRYYTQKHISAAEDREIRRLAIEVSIEKSKMHNEAIRETCKGSRPPEAYFSISYQNILEFLHREMTPEETKMALKRIDEALNRAD